jgi:cell division initiation protein
MDIGTIVGKTFRKRFRGADQDEVDSFLREIVEYCRLLIQQKELMEQKIASLEAEASALRAIEHSIQQTLVQAQEMSARTVDAAKKQAELIRHEAEVNASRVVEEAYASLTSVKEAAIILTAKKDAIRERLKMFLRSELDMLQTFDAGETAFSPERTQRAMKESNEMKEIEEIIKSLGDEQ